MKGAPLTQPVRIYKKENTYDLHVMWSIHNKCNYACSYCPDILHNGNTAWLNLLDLKGFIDRIHEHYVGRLKHKNILFSFTGGEPTLWKDFLPFIEYIHSKGFLCGLTSNGSVSLQFWERVSTYFNYICLSFHPESATPEKFLRAYKFLHDHPQTVIPTLRIMMHPNEEMWHKSEVLIEELKKFPNWVYQCVHILDDYGQASKRINYNSRDKEEYLVQNSHREQFTQNEFVHVPNIDFNHGVEYDDDHNEPLDENKLINQGHVNFNGWDCNIGLEQLFIHPSGKIYRAGCRVGGELGHICLYERINFLISPIKCNLSGCYCPTDIRVTKSSPGKKLEYSKSIYSKELKQVGTSTSPFSFRLSCFWQSDRLHINMTPYFTALDNFVNYILQKKQIPQKKLLLCISLGPSYEIKQLSSSLESFSLNNFVKTIDFFIGKLDEVCCQYLVSHFSTIIAQIRGRDDLLGAELLLNSVQKNYGVKLILNLDLDEFNDISLVNDFLTQCRKKKYYEVYIRKGEGIQGNVPNDIFPEKGLQYLEGFEEGLQYYLRNSRHHIYAFDETCILGQNRVSTLKAENIVRKPYKTRGWLCYMGDSAVTLNSNGDIKTSSCPQAKHLGNIFYPQTYLNNFPKQAYQCEQEYCQNFTDRLIRKKSQA